MAARSLASSEPASLNGLRVLDLSGRAGQYCGKLFADLGAEVILIEPPAGSAVRREGPFLAASDKDASIPFLFLNGGKKSVVLDLDDAEGQEALRSLVRTAHLIIETERPGTMERRGLGHAALRSVCPHLVHVSITPFGQDGPYAGYDADDLTLMALGGLLSLGGYFDGEPVVAYGQQAYAAGSLFAAVAAIAAIIRAERSGEGEFIDVSIQEAVALGLENAAQFYDLEGVVRKRGGGEQSAAGAGQFPCRDGYFYMLGAGLSSPRFWMNTTQWLEAEGVEGASELKDSKWLERGYAGSQDAKKRFLEIFLPFSMSKTKAELHAAAKTWRVPAAPVNSPKEVLASAQLHHRAFFVEATHRPSGRQITIPGAPYHLSETPWRIQGPAPELNEHWSLLEAANAAAAADVAQREAPRAARPLEGVRVADFSWIGAGSYTTKMLADLGADVIKIESSAKLDSLRVSPPFKDKIRGVNRSGYFADRNTSKRSITVNLKTQAGKNLVLDLIRESDIVANNFTPGTMEKLGFGYDEVRRINPKVVYIGMSVNGQDGPEADMIGYGLTIGAMCGLQYTSGRQDREPTGTGTHYPDHIPNPCHAAFATLAALRRQRRSGSGQKIDLAQTEPTICLIADAIIDAAANGADFARQGNRHGGYAPRGVYKCGGDDKWLAIAVTSDAAWSTVVRVLGLDGGSMPSAWRETEGRLRDQDEIDDLIAEAVKHRDVDALMSDLLAGGIAAGAVRTAADLIERDPQLAHRRHWIRLPHAEMGEPLHNGQPFRFASVDVSPRSAAPLLGEHTREICRDLLRLPEHEIDRLTEAGVLT